MPHQKLPAGLCEIGVSGNVLAWIQDYLTGREQFVCVEVEESNHYDCFRGINRGSVLGPVLFSIYVRHMPSRLRPFIDHTILFADDVSFDCSRDSITDITTCLTQALRVLVPWCTERCPSVNMDKTHTLLIRPKGTPSAQMKVLFSRHTLAQVLSTRFLGIIIDDVLSWTEHLNALSRKPGLPRRQVPSGAVDTYCMEPLHSTMACLLMRRTVLLA